MAVKTVIGTCQHVLKRSHDYEDFSVGRRVMSAVIEAWSAVGYRRCIFLRPQ